LGLIHIVQLIGTSVRVISGYCLLERELRMLPWNRSERRLTARLAWGILTARPGRGGLIRFDGGADTTPSACAIGRASAL
jgi:hypothetical protein